MSVFDTKTLETLEFPKVINQLVSFASSQTTKRKIKQLKPSADIDQIKSSQNETEDGVVLLERKDGIPIAVFEDVQAHLKRLEIGASLNGEEVAQVGRLLKIARDIIRYFENIREEGDIQLKQLNSTSDHLDALPEILKEIERTVDEGGYVLDSASPALRQVRGQIQSAQASIRQVLNGIVKGKDAKYLTDTLITMRNDRFVLPVKAENRKQFGGVVHDQSSSGQTIYVEPQRVVDLNNRLRQLTIDAQKEEERVLSEISFKLAQNTKVIEKNQVLLTHLDFISAKAKYARSIGAVRPQVSLDNYVDLHQARHPLLDTETVVPNDITIGEDYEAVIVTGPNTGGKTIVLKTLGLLQIMGQAGLQIPAESPSTIGVFDNVYADIGDEQSIEQSLSTFSSHMTNIIRILERLTDKSLVLIDELGSGTDPQEGAALAIAIMEYIRRKEAWAVASSHYPELKAYGYQQEKTVNASMAFDVDTLSPTFKLQIGIPGRSNALEISRRLGLPEEIIQRSKELIGDASQSVEDMITDLDFQRQRSAEEREHYQEQYIEAYKLRRQLEAAYDDLNQKRDQLLEEARKKANQEIEKAQEDAEKIISDIRAKQLNLGQSVVKEHELIDAQTQLDRLRTAEEKELLSKNKHIKKAVKEEGLQEGDQVHVASLGQQGTLLEKSGKKAWMVQLGSMKMKVDGSSLERIAGSSSEKKEEQVISHRTSRPNVKTQVDIRGERYETGVDQVSQYLDAALLNNYETVTIIHGHGTGALREGVHKLLKRHPQVESFELAPANQGGTGATIVHLKSS